MSIPSHYNISPTTGFTSRYGAHLNSGQVEHRVICSSFVIVYKFYKISIRKYSMSVKVKAISSLVAHRSTVISPG